MYVSGSSKFQLSPLDFESSLHKAASLLNVSLVDPQIGGLTACILLLDRVEPRGGEHLEAKAKVLRH